MTIETGTVETPKKGVLTRGKGFLKALAAALLGVSVVEARKRIWRRITGRGRD